jgi:hypothetical protein
MQLLPTLTSPDGPLALVVRQSDWEPVALATAPIDVVTGPLADELLPHPDLELGHRIGDHLVDALDELSTAVG